MVKLCFLYSLIKSQTEEISAGPVKTGVGGGKFSFSLCQLFFAFWKFLRMITKSCLAPRVARNYDKGELVKSVSAHSFLAVTEFPSACRFVNLR